MITIVVIEQADDPQEVLQSVQKADVIIRVNSLNDSQIGHVHVKEGFKLRPDQGQAVADAILMAAEDDIE